MSAAEQNVRIPVDLTNPGQFFACCGLLELADRLWPGAEGWFERKEFCLKIERCRRHGCTLPKRVDGSLICGSPADASRDLLVELLTQAKTLKFDVGDDDESDDADDHSQDSGYSSRSNWHAVTADPRYTSTGGQRRRSNRGPGP